MLQMKMFKDILDIIGKYPSPSPVLNYEINSQDGRLGSVLLQVVSLCLRNNREIMRQVALHIVDLLDPVGLGRQRRSRSSESSTSCS